MTVLVNGAYPRGGARVPRSGGARTPTLVIVCPRDASGFLLVSPRRGSRKKFYSLLCRYVIRSARARWRYSPLALLWRLQSAHRAARLAARGSRPGSDPSTATSARTLTPF